MYKEPIRGNSMKNLKPGCRCFYCDELIRFADPCVADQNGDWWHKKCAKKYATDPNAHKPKRLNKDKPRKTKKDTVEV